MQLLIDNLATLPGVGPKGAARISFHLLSKPHEVTTSLVDALIKVRDEAKFCELCGNISALEYCRICMDSRRERDVICVVEEPKDVVAIERTREFKGLYHVLGGALNPLAGIGPDQIRIRELLQRVASQDFPDETKAPPVKEVILATDPNTEGEATATYLVRTMSVFPDIRITRLASGLPMGGDLEFADELTLSRALSGRRSLNG